MDARTLFTATAILGGAMALPSMAQASFGGGGGGDGGVSGGDFAIRAELQNPQFIEPGSPYGYYRSYSQGPGYPIPAWAAPRHPPVEYGAPYGRPYRRW